MQTKVKMTETLISQSYVLDDNNEYTLRYYFVHNSDNCETQQNGIKITMIHENKKNEKVEYLDENDSNIRSLIMRYAENFVFPTTLHNLIEDYIYEQQH